MKSINLNLKNRSNSDSLLLLRTTINGQRLVYSTGIKVPTKYWDDNKSRLVINSSFSRARAINAQIEHLKVLFAKILQQYYLSGIVPTINMIKKELDIHFKKKSSVADSFNKYIDIFIEQRFEDPTIKKASVKVYGTFRNHFLRYVSNRVIAFEDLSVDFIVDFIKYLQLKGYSDNHVCKIIVTMKTILNTAAEKGINKNRAYKSKLVSVPRRPADGIYLNEDELKLIEALEIGKQRLSETRDLFLIGCYTGLRYGDFTSLKTDNVIKLNTGKKAFRVITSKTSDLLIIPIHPVVQKILDKHNHVLPKGVSNQKMNAHLKLIGEKAGLNDLIVKRIFRNNRAVKYVHKKFELICTHTARRSFASNAYKAGIPSISIMKITGHKREETFMKYIKLSLEEHAIKMAENSFFN